MENDVKGFDGERTSYGQVTWDGQSLKQEVRRDTYENGRLVKSEVLSPNEIDASTGYMACA